MNDETVTLAYTEWTLVELDREPVAIAADQLAPMLVLDLDGRVLTLRAGEDAVARLSC